MRRGPLLLLFILSLVGLLLGALLAMAHDPTGSEAPEAERQQSWAIEIFLWLATAVLGVVFTGALVLFRREVRVEVRAMRSERARLEMKKDLQQFHEARRFDRRGNT